MTVIDKIVHYIFLLIFGPVLKLVYLGSKVEEKSDAFLQNIYPGPFDPYTLAEECTATQCQNRGIQEGGPYSKYFSHFLSIQETNRYLLTIKALYQSFKAWM